MNISAEQRQKLLRSSSARLASLLAQRVPPPEFLLRNEIEFQISLRYGATRFALHLLKYAAKTMTLRVILLLAFAPQALAVKLLGFILGVHKSEPKIVDHPRIIKPTTFEIHLN